MGAVINRDASCRGLKKVYLPFFSTLFQRSPGAVATLSIFTLWLGLTRITGTALGGPRARPFSGVSWPDNATIIPVASYSECSL